MRALAVLWAWIALCGCGGESGNDGDCSASIRFEGELYRSHNALPDRTPLGASVGRGEVVGCGGLEADAVAQVDVRRIRGVPAATAIGAHGDWSGLYIREDLAADRSSWPEALRR